MRCIQNIESWKGWVDSMRMQFSSDLQQMMEKVRPYLTGKINPEYVEGTPDEMKILHKKAIDLADKEYMEAIM